MVFDGQDIVKSPNKKMTPKTSGKSRFDRQRAEDIVRNAHERGYLKAATEDAIWENIGEKCDIEDIKYLNMNGIHLHTVRSVDLCRTLRICVLSCNYITTFDALLHCRQLMYLDLHGNQVTKIPGHRFWAALQDLKIVYLHDNGVSKLEQIQNIASSSSLSVLTLFDTPLSLKPNYRHHVVNSIWTLKALDFQVISDEEIIEDAVFGGKFAAGHQSFSLSLYKADKKERNFEEARRNVNRVLAQVNAIQARNSPVLIVQKYIRGYLARQQMKYMQDMRIWAAVSIQRFYRHYKGHTGTLPPPASPAPSRSSTAMTSFDYDTYVKGLKPGYATTPSITPRTSEEKLKNRSSSKTVSIVVEPFNKIDEEKALSDYSMPTSPPEEKEEESEEFVKITTKVSINLRRLETSTSDIIRAKEEAVTIVKGARLETRARKSRMDNKESRLLSKDKIGQSIKSCELVREEKRISDLEKRAKRNERIGRHSTIQVFFGPILKTHPRTERDLDESPVKRDPRQIKFRLSGMIPPITTTDPLLKILSEKREAGKMVREAARDHELQVLNKPRKKVVRRPLLTTDQRLFIRTHGTMGMACLRAVQQAYRDRTVSELKSARSDRVATMREERETAKDRVRAFKQEYQQATLRRRLRDGVKTAEALKERATLRTEQNERLNTARAVTAEQRKSRQADFAFVNDFSCQQTSVSNALLKHDRTTHKEETWQDASEMVRKGKENTLEQHSLVKRFMEHRQLLRQAETAMARAELDSRLLQDASQRAEETRHRMQQIKSRQQMEYFTVPPTLAPSTLPPLAVVSPDQVEVWSRLPRTDWKPRLHDRTQSEPTRSIGHRPYSYQPRYVLA